MQLTSLPKGILEILRVIEEENNMGTHAIETDLRPEILGKFSNFINEFFQMYGGDFHNLLPTREFIKNLPQNISFEQAETESCSFHLGPDDGKTRRIIYEAENDRMEAFLETLDHDGKSLDKIPLSDLDQRTFPILAGVIAAPLISIKRERRKIGILFDGSTIDVKNWECLRDYLGKICLSGNLSAFLLIFTGGSGIINAMYSDDINRVGMYSSGVFTRANSYRRSMDITQYLVSSLRGSSIPIPILFFLGAGASIHAGIPRTRDLMISAMRRLLHRSDDLDLDFDDLKKEFRHKLISQGRLLTEAGETSQNLKITFERIMTEELSHYETMEESPTLNELRRIIISKSPSVAHYNLSKLVDSKNKPLFLTTNYDDLVERSLKKRKWKAFFNDEDFEEAEAHIGKYLNNESNSTPVFKFHGTIHDFQSIRTSVMHTLSLEPNKSMFLTKILKGDLLREVIPNYNESTVRIVFIGYSFNDPDINVILRGIQKSNAKLHAYFVNPNQRTNSILLGFAESAFRKDYLNSTISLPFSFFSEKIKSLLVGGNND